jgi:hypothetical protein
VNRKLMLAAATLAASASTAAIAQAASSPSISVSTVTSITNSSAKLNGDVNPNGSKTTYHFEWGLTNGYGVASADKSAGSGTASVTVGTTASQLLPGTTYHYRLVAVNRYGTTAGSDHTFHTAGPPPPQVATGPANAITANSAEVTGVVNPEGAPTTFAFQFGPTAAYGYQTANQVVPAGTAPLTVAEMLTALAQFTTFHYRIVAFHGSVVEYGLDQTFITLPSPRFVPRVTARTVPRHAPTRPYTFSTSGHVSGPANVPMALACSEDVSINFFNGRRKVGSELATVQPDCSFSAALSFSRLPHAKRGQRSVKLRITIHFRGNGYLAPADAKKEHVTLGR